VNGAVVSGDIDGDTLAFAVVAPPAHGTVTSYNPATGGFTYTASNGYSGADAFTYSVNDGRGGVAQGLVSVAIRVRNQSPVCTAAVAAPRLLWPPNHQFVAVAINGVTDPDGGALTITVTGIRQDERPLSGNGSAEVGGTIVDGRAQVRAERSGTGDGRIYEILFTAADGKGGSCTGAVTVGVPHDQGDRRAIDSSVRYDSTGMTSRTRVLEQPLPR
jgi:hypothetical protein